MYIFSVQNDFHIAFLEKIFTEKREQINIVLKSYANKMMMNMQSIIINKRDDLFY